MSKEKVMSSEQRVMTGKASLKFSKKFSSLIAHCLLLITFAHLWANEVQSGRKFQLSLTIGIVMLQLRSIVIFVFIFVACILNAAPNPSAKEIAAMEVRLVKLVNNERIKHRLPPLRTWALLFPPAKKHSQDRASGREKSPHGGFDKRADAIMKAASVESVGENVAFCYLMADPLTAAVDGWMKSHSHRINILGDFTETAIGIAYSKEGRCYMTQLFARMR